MTRKVEIFTGAYASGKSEIAINRALFLKTVTLVDLDTVEPAYTLRPVKAEIEKQGIKVITQDDYFGRGETGNTITPEQMNCLSIDGDMVIDVGYGVGGLDILDVINEIDKEKDLNIYIVINTSKFETLNVDSIVEYVNWSKGLNKYEWKQFRGIVCNPHLGDETSKDDIINGFEVIKKAALILNLPLISLCVCEKFYSEFKDGFYQGVPVWSLTRYMPKALW